MASRIVSVLGAMGTQGVPAFLGRMPISRDNSRFCSIKALLKDGTFVPRAITRNPDAEGAQKLKQSGVEVVKCAIRSTRRPCINGISGGKHKNVLHYDHTQKRRYNVSLHLGGFLENYWKFGLLTKTSTGFDVVAFTWVDVPAATPALLKTYTDPSKNISGKSYPIVGTITPYAELAAMTGKALGKEVTFITAPPMGMAPLDEMYSTHAKYSGLYTTMPVPNPDFVALRQVRNHRGVSGD
ncbi:hypothetical protein DFH07DRAFT_769030 [Mycena maculata]|uniref:NmrA-like domain-containing protein n=1 Tax=Mycena maculata TaxID=230809 RepID=A0AAD7JRT8_9AGAR|nr:hypothetical protein DFH07DRAFT_769030 [Mycena maculata]